MNNIKQYGTSFFEIGTEEEIEKDLIEINKDLFENKMRPHLKDYELFKWKKPNGEYETFEEYLKYKCYSNHSGPICVGRINSIDKDGNYDNCVTIYHVDFVQFIKP